MRYGEIKIIAKQIFFDNIAVADIREDVLATTEDNFKKKILSVNKPPKDSDDKEYDTGWYNGYEAGHANGYADAVMRSAGNE